MKKSYIKLLIISTIIGLTGLTAGASAPLTNDTFTQVAEKAVNGVVSVKSFATPRQMQGYNGLFNDPFFEYFFGSPQQQPRQEQPEPKQQQIGLGSGVILDASGYIVTNNHVIADAERLEVTLNDNRNFPATVIGSDPVTDLALIKIDAPDLHMIPMGDSDSLKVGEWVLAVGNPFGFTSSVTAGVVSAKARNISSSTGTPSNGGIQAYIQHDAAVNSGNSGGALLNLEGELVGINTAIYSRTGTYAGCSFAIPTSIVRKVVDDLQKFGTVQRALLGITMRDVTPELIAEKGLSNVHAGIYVENVTDRSGAKAAGIEKGDVIIGVNNVSTPNGAKMQELIARFSPGDHVILTIMRDGKRINKDVELRNLSGNTAIVKPDSVESLGAEFTDITEDKAKELELSHGVSVKITGNGAFKSAGVKSDYIILSVNNTPVTKASDIEEAFKAIRKSASPEKVMYLSGIYPNGKRAYYAVNLDD